MRRWMAAAVLLSSCVGKPASPPERLASPWRAAADSVARWLEAQARPSGPGVGWPVDALEPGEAGVGLGSGDAGPVAFLLAHAALTGDSASAGLARRGALALEARIPDRVRADQQPPETSLYYGWPSVARILERAHATLGDARFAEAARRVVALVAAAARATSDTTAEWSGVYDDLLFGNAGTMLFMAWAAERFDDSTARGLAHRAGLGVAARMEETLAGPGWRFRRDRPYVLPNFTHGAAGTAYALLAVGRLVDDPRLDRAAVRAARSLIAAADTAGGGFWLPYGWPNQEWQGRLDHGWAHGPAGSARLFLALAREDPAGGWSEWATRAAAELAGHPAFLPAADGDSLPNDLRFGRAGVAWFLEDFADALALEPPRRSAESLTRALLERGRRDPTGLWWETPRPAFLERPGEPAVFTGFFQGASGFGTLLLRVGADPRAWREAGFGWLLDPAR
ncbi:MAG: lanthionine synthetase LanC family protein [Gemmatimonadales bacterium]